MQNKKILIALVASLTLGLAPFRPEPHLFGKIRWVMGGGEGMALADYGDLLMHGLPWLFLIYFLLKKLMGNDVGQGKSLEDVLAGSNVHFIDVREKREVASGMIYGATHIPLGSLTKNLDKIQNMEGDIVLYCKSGMRSGMGTSKLKKNGITNVYNGGGYAKLNQKVNNR